MKIQLFYPINTKRKVIFSTLSLFAAILAIVIIANPLLAADCEKDISMVSNKLNEYAHNLETNFEKYMSHSFNPFEESKEVKRISGILEEASKFKYVHGISSAYKIPTQGGDCWAMSDWLYNHIKKTGVECRIIQYETPLASNHRSVQIKSNGEWVDLPYEMFNFDYRFGAAYSKPGMFIYKS
ncbi:hypothetical protein [Methanobacterium sp.]|uniref:hypothetical protein n=1 Tax=Methanobacterium sp. TaxID=2164 RepID=UPI003C72B1A5